MEILMFLSNFQPKKITILAIFIRKIVKNSKIGGFGCRKSSKFEENSMTNTFSLVPQINHPVALCACHQRDQIGSQSVLKSRSTEKHEVICPKAICI